MIPLPQKPKITKKEANIITAEIQGLYPGYGITIGNSLRRILLSSLEGAAITQVKIKDVPHEFSTLPGVAEDIILILLNLKKLRFKMFGNEPQTATLKISGEKGIKASDFKLPSQVEIINQDASIATLTGKKSSLEMEIRIERGVGYETVDQRKEDKTEIGVMAVDSVYSPIVKVAYKVEDMRVGERTDFDRLVMEIETDGTMDPEEAFFKACEILHQHLAIFLEKEKEIDKTKEKKEEKEEKGDEKAETDSLKIKIEDLKLSERVINVLMENKIKTVAGLVKKNEDDVLAFKGMGEKGAQEIKKALKKLDLGLKEQN